MFAQGTQVNTHDRPSISRVGHDKRLAVMFFLMLVAVTYFVATMSSPLVPFEVPFGLVLVLPLQYWIMLLVTLLLLCASLILRNAQYLWASGLTLSAIVPGLGNLIHAYPTDIFATVATQYISRIGTFNPAQHIFLNFPGSEIVFASISVVMRIDPVTVVHAYGLVYNPLLLVACYISLRRFGVTEVASVLGALTFVLGFYLQGVLIYSSLNGFFFYVCIASLILMPLTSKSKGMVLIILFFTAMIITHAFSPFLTMAGVIGLWIGGKIVERMKTRRISLSVVTEANSFVSLTTLLMLLLVTTVFWAYLADGPFSAGLFKVSTVTLTALIEQATSPLLSSQTSYQVQYAALARLYAPILFIPFLIYLVTVPDRRRLQMLFLSLGLAGAVVVAVAGYGAEFLPRIFAFALVPLSYGIANLFASAKRSLRIVAFIAFILVLALHLPAHYGQDAFQQIPISTIDGQQFLAIHSHPNSTYVGITREFSWNYYFDVYRSNFSDQETGVFYHILDYPANNGLIYTEGDNASISLIAAYDSSAYNSIYSNGLFEVYT